MFLISHMIFLLLCTLLPACHQQFRFQRLLYCYRSPLPISCPIPLPSGNHDFVLCVYRSIFQQICLEQLLSARLSSRWQRKEAEITALLGLTFQIRGFANCGPKIRTGLARFCILIINQEWLLHFEMTEKKCFL